MSEIESFDGKKVEISSECIGCAIEKGEVDVSKGKVLEHELFEAHQDFEVPIPGFVILSTRRHISSVADFTEEESKEFFPLLKRIRQAMREVLGIEEVYLFQNEDSSHHFHVWVFPRLDWMERFGRKIQSVRPIMKHARENMKTEDNLKEVERAARELRYFMKK